MYPTDLPTTAFEGTRRIAAGRLADVARAVKTLLDQSPHATVTIFDDATARQVELDFRGDVERVLASLAEPSPATPAGDAPPEERRGPGRPKLGVVAREVTLLPRHWEWLGRQPGGASVALRKLVEEARRVNERADRQREAREVAYRFMTTQAGDLAGYEDAVRALFAGDRIRFVDLTDTWPVDVRDYARKLAEDAFIDCE